MLLECVCGGGALRGRRESDLCSTTPRSSPGHTSTLNTQTQRQLQHIIRHVKLIAEAWDCDGLNQVGAFPHYGGRWAEWNGTFRDTVRQFIKGTDGPFAGGFASALCGSPGLYASTTPGDDNWWQANGGAPWKGGRAPTASVNFVCAHDGFTLADLVAYNEKHNEVNAWWS